MEDYEDSPLATRQRRDSLARKPLSRLAKTPKPVKYYAEEEEDEDEEDFTPITTRHETRRSLGSGSRTDGTLRMKSPPNYDFKTSSFISPASAEFSKMKTSSPSSADFSKMVSPPQVSMIQPQAQKTTPQTTSAKKKKSPRQVLVQNESSPEDDNDKEDEDNDTDTPVSTRTRSRFKDGSKTTIIQRSQRSFNQSKKIEDSNFGCSACTYLLFVISALAVGYLATQMYQDQELVETNGGHPFKRFSRDLESIQADFPKQPKRTWASISSQVRRILYGKSTQPSCILVMYNETAAKTSTCLVKAFGNSLYYALNIGIEAQQLSHIKSDKILDRGELYENIDRELSKAKTVVLQDIDQLQSLTAMALHGICDEGYMPEETPKPVVIMTMKTLTKSAKDFETAADTIRGLWEKDLGTDKVHPLISRIASVLIKVLPEPSPKC